MGRRYDVDSATLAPAQQQSLRDVVRAAIDEPRREPALALRDARSYEIHVVSDGLDTAWVVYDARCRRRRDN